MYCPRTGPNRLYYLAQSSDLEDHPFLSFRHCGGAVAATVHRRATVPEPAGNKVQLRDKNLLGWGPHEIDIDIDLVCVRVVLL